MHPKVISLCLWAEANSRLALQEWRHSRNVSLGGHSVTFQLYDSEERAIGSVDMEYRERPRFADVVELEPATSPDPTANQFIIFKVIWAERDGKLAPTAHAKALKGTQP